MNAGAKTTRLVMSLLALVAVSIGLLAALVPSTAEARASGPEYGYTRYALERSDTSAITRLQIPVYFQNRPTGTKGVNITNFERGSNAVSIQIVGVGNRSGNGGFGIPSNEFSFHSPTQTWRAVVDVRLNSNSAHYSHYVLFRLSLDDGSGHIGYSGSFAQAAQEYGNWNAAHDDYVRYPIRSYSFDMATPCNISSNTRRQISLYDLDSGNNDNGGRTVSVTVRDLTSGQTLISQTGGGGMGQGQTWSRDVIFRPDHRYRVTLHDISANNMIRFNFPFDDVNEEITCPSPATVRPYTRVNGSAGGMRYINPSDTAEFVAFTRVSNYRRMDHNISTRIERQLDGGGGWDNLATRSFVADSNGDTTNWGAVNIGLHTSAGGNIPNDTRQFCYRARIVVADGANVTSSPSDPSCARVRAGQTSATTSATPATIEPGSGEIATLTGGMTTTGFRDWAETTSDNYTILCDYSVTITAGAGAGSNNGTISGGASSGSCNQLISSNGARTPVNRTYSTDVNTRIGTRVCITINLSAYDDAFLAAGTTSQDCTTVAAKPYLKVAAGDVFAGKGFAPTTEACTTTPNARIVSWNRGDVANNGQWRGAGTTYAAYATGTIDGFASSQFAPGASPTPYPNEPKGLTFANVASTGTWGGNYQGATCIPDYYGTKPANATTFSGATWGAGAWNAANAAAASPTNPDGTVAYAKTGNLTLAGGTINSGSNILLYVQGNVYLAGNITAGVPSIPSGSTNAVLETPGLLLVATGNIYVASGVNQLYGSFAAQPTNATTGGNFYSCASANGTPLNLSATNYSACNNQLVITGGVAAKKVHLLRTYGSLSQDTNGGQPIGAAGSNGYQNAGEVIIYNPVLWLRRLAGTSGGSSGGTTYDAMTTLPPVL